MKKLNRLTYIKDSVNGEELVRLHFKIQEIVDWINKRDKQLQVAREAKRKKSGG